MEVFLGLVISLSCCQGNETLKMKWGKIFFGKNNKISGIEGVNAQVPESGQRETLIFVSHRQRSRQ